MNFPQKTCFKFLDKDATSEDVYQFIAHVRNFSRDADLYQKHFSIFDYFKTRKFHFPNIFLKFVPEVKNLMQEQNSLYYYLFAICLDFGCGIERDFFQAVSFYEKAVELNDYRAMITLDFAYDMEKVVDPILKNLCNYFKKHQKRISQEL
jgi:TPR repeat protein